MKIVRESLIEGAQRAQGIAIVIDVFRAFSVTPIFFYLGAEKVIFVRNPEEAFLLKSDHDDLILAGEINEQLIPGFDLGNSPSELIGRPKEFLKGKVIVQRTTAGVSGVISALNQVEKVILGSYVMARAISNYILSQKPLPEVLTIVAMGSRGITRAPEDEGCAGYLEHLLTGKRYDHLDTVRDIIFNETAQKFMRGNKAYLPKEDPLICLQWDLFNFVLVAKNERGLAVVRRGSID